MSSHFSVPSDRMVLVRRFVILGVNSAEIERMNC